MKIFVANLSSETSGDDLRLAFESFGRVRSATIVIDGATGESRRFGFVIMPSAREATNAIEKMNGRDLQGQKIDVQKSRAKRKHSVGARRRIDSRNSLGQRHDRRHY